MKFSGFVADLFNKSLTSGEVPPGWKLANVSPIFKKGKKPCVSNYRPVSLTVNLCKVFESILTDNMIEHLQRHSVIKSLQHGFVRNRSCLTNLLVFMEEVTNYIDRGCPMDVIYLDFQKAFDKVPQKRLLVKLAAHGITGNVLKWIENWLSNRKPEIVLKAAELEHLEKYQDYLHIYTDGSKTENGRVAAAFCIPQLNIQCSWRLTDNVSIYAAEIMAITLAVEWVLAEESHNNDENKIVIFSDSLSGLLSIKSGSSKSRPNLLVKLMETIGKLTRTHQEMR